MSDLSRQMAVLCRAGFCAGRTNLSDSRPAQPNVTAHAAALVPPRNIGKTGADPSGPLPSQGQAF